MLHLLGSLPRRLRWRLQRWNASDDRVFHDSLFGRQQYDPFTFSYPGYVTIRRFADLAETRLGNARHVVDLGCGPGEITCELAQRRPDVLFTGIDHSTTAIARATDHARRLGLANTTFTAADITRYDAVADLVMMFDAFHHVLDPAAFVSNLRTDRVFVIEPGGDWLGGWARALELDWIVDALDTIRARIQWQMGGPARDTSKAADFPAEAGSDGRPRGEPVEHRYTLADFKKYFDGFGLAAVGTIAGVEDYPPDPYARVPLREQFGRIAYDTLVAIEELLVAQNLDLHAKHWAIYAERGAEHSLRTPRALNPNDGEPPMRLQGPYDVEFVSYDGSATAPSSATILSGVIFRNKGWRTWSSASPNGPVFLSYHWLDRDGAAVIEDGLRTPLPHAVAPGDTCTMSCRIETPAAPGRYTLALDLVEEGVTWFSRAGARVLKIAFEVRSTAV